MFGAIFSSVTNFFDKWFLITIYLPCLAICSIFVALVIFTQGVGQVIQQWNSQSLQVQASIIIFYLALLYFISLILLVFLDSITKFYEGEWECLFGVGGPNDFGNVNTRHGTSIRIIYNITIKKIYDTNIYIYKSRYNDLNKKVKYIHSNIIFLKFLKYDILKEKSDLLKEELQKVKDVDKNDLTGIERTIDIFLRQKLSKEDKITNKQLNELEPTIASHEGIFTQEMIQKGVKDLKSNKLNIVNDRKFKFPYIFYDDFPSRLTDLIKIIYEIDDEVKHYQENESRYNDELYYYYPSKENVTSDVRPTRLGNVLLSAYFYVSSRYGIDPVIYPRLLPLLPPSFMDTLNENKSYMDSLIIISFLSIWFAVPGSLYFIFGAPSWPLFLSVFLGGLLVSWLSYTSAIEAAKQYGETLKVAFDLYRGELLKQLCFEKPGSPAEEEAEWRKISQFVCFGEHADLPYDGAPEKASKFDQEN
jgi:hypothetical protein